jgi:hypothetical protein
MTDKDPSVPNEGPELAYMIGFADALGWLALGGLNRAVLVVRAVEAKDVRTLALVSLEAVEAFRNAGSEVERWTDQGRNARELSQIHLPQEQWNHAQHD